MSFFEDHRQILDDFRAGKESALKAVYLHYISDVERFVRTGWFNPKTQIRIEILDFEQQVDLIQETFLRAFSERTRLSYDGIQPYKGFLLSIARHVILDHVRKKYRDALHHICLELDDEKLSSEQIVAMNQLKVAPEASEEALHWKRCTEAAANFLSTLDEKRQTFARLRFYEELPLLEVARQLDLTRGKARFLENQLARLLKRYLAGKGIDKKCAASK